jgi:hypothetical protein
MPNNFDLPNLEDTTAHWTGIALDVAGQGGRGLMIELHPAAAREPAWFVQVFHFGGIKDVQKRALTPLGVRAVWRITGIPEGTEFHWGQKAAEPAPLNPFYPVGSMDLRDGAYLRWNGSWDDPVPVVHEILKKHGIPTHKQVIELREGDTFSFNGELCTIIDRKVGRKYVSYRYTTDGVRLQGWKAPLGSLVEVILHPARAKKDRWDILMADDRLPG